MFTYFMCKYTNDFSFVFLFRAFLYLRLFSVSFPDFLSRPFFFLADGFLSTPLSWPPLPFCFVCLLCLSLGAAWATTPQNPAGSAWAVPAKARRATAATARAAVQARAFLI